MEADILARRDGRDTVVRRPRFLSKIHFSHFPNSPFYRKIENQHFCQTLNFFYGFMGNRVGQNARIDRGIISDFREKCDFDSCFAGQSPCVHENPDFHFLY